MQQPMLFDEPPVTTTGGGGWRPPDELPELGAYDELALDCETTGLDIWGVDVPIGISICTMPDHRRWYFPWGHRGGGNLDPELVRRWAQTELRDKHLYNLNIKFESHMLHKWGIDLEAQGCELHEVQHLAGLLDERRHSFSLNALAEAYLQKKKIVLPAQARVADLPARLVGPYAEEDALLAAELVEKLTPLVRTEELEQVLTLEDALLHCTCAMERNGALIDVEKLNRWVTETQDAYAELILAIWRQTTLRVNPDAPLSMLRLYDHLNLPHGLTEAGNPSFTKEALVANANPVVQQAFHARQINDLRTNFLLKYQRAARNGLLRYSLHQLRNDQYGTISGRYSASSVNVQQVPKPDKQPDATSRWIMRELFIPASGRAWLSADASQIEFRLFAHYSRSQRLIDAYNNDPETDFHQLVTNIIRRLIPDYSRTLAKNFNFMKIYGGGRDRAAAMLGKTRAEVDPLVDAYDGEFPEAQRLVNQAARLAERRGYVRTFLGRRSRFSEGDRFYAALNRVIQGTAADVMKLKLLQLYRERQRLGLTMRFPVHDEVCGDLDDPARARDVQELLNEQSLRFRVPITWDVTVSDSWRCNWQRQHDDGTTGVTPSPAPSWSERNAPRGYSSSKTKGGKSS